MASKDNVSNLSIVRQISPGDYDTSGQPDPQVIDTQGFESVSLAFIAGVITTAQTLVLQHSLDNSAWATVPGADIIGGEAVRDAWLATGTANDVIKVIGYTGGRRYLRVTCTSANDGAIFSIVGILGNPQNAPIS